MGRNCSRLQDFSMFTRKNIFISPLAITKFKVIPIKFLEKKLARAGVGSDRSAAARNG